ncbi:hypothetical protein [Rhizobium binxianense]|uniref:hypothetical protein n=1 Tax=Rhizobium binxianense TaxID=3024242 RepID=UPI0023A9C462|nr:hypothetical protein [Rhizobium sp. MJ22]WEA26919.1 hypothetical protein PO862_06180 [Rhizobium sp. MJ22]
MIQKKTTEHDSRHPALAASECDLIVHIMTEDEQETLAKKMTRRAFKKDSVIVKIGTNLKV